MLSLNTMFGEKSNKPVKFYHRGKKISVVTAFGLYQKAVQFGFSSTLTVSGLPITDKVDKLTKVLEKSLAPGTVTVGRNGSMSNGLAQLTFIGPAAAARAQKKFDGFRLDKKHQLKVSGPNVPKNRNLPNNALFQRLQGRIAQFAARPQRSGLMNQLKDDDDVSASSRLTKIKERKKLLAQIKKGIPKKISPWDEWGDSDDDSFDDILYG